MKKDIGISIPRKDAWDKVTGKAKYTDDEYPKNMLYAKLVTSKVAHAKIKLIDTSTAEKMPGVKAIVLGSQFSRLCGILIEDRPILAIDKVRYFGEPVAIVVAQTEHEAENAASFVKIEYENLPVVSTVLDALKSDAILIHENLDSYVINAEDVKPQCSSNIAATYHILKGNMSKGWQESDVIVVESFSLPQSDHIAMETRTARAEILGDGTVRIDTSSQAPFTVKELISKTFQIEDGKVQVHAPFLGGAFGGKSAVQLEFLAYLASSAVDGRLVRITNSREEDIATSPCGIGMEATIRLGATKDGVIKAAELSYFIDAGAYSDISPYMSKAILVDCTGPYNIENVSCESLCVYTNHTYSTSLRGFAHESYTFCIERAINILATRCGIDSLRFRLKNAISAGHYTPTQVESTLSNTGNLSECILKLKNLINWDEGIRIELGNNKIRATGISCLWKTPVPPTNASSGAFITFNKNGSVNLNTGVVEMGSGGKTQLAQILAKKLNMDVDRIHIIFEVDTRTSPYHWKTVASMTNYLAGRAVIKAADDVIEQLKNLASIALRCPVEDLDIADEKVFVKHLPKYAIGFQDLVFGLKYPDGNAVGSQIMGRGGFVFNHLTHLSEDTGKGKTSPTITVGAQAVEIELDIKEYTYRLIKAATVMDVGNLINPKEAEAIIRSGMSMGLSLASREEFIYNIDNRLENTSIRNYKLLHIGQEPDYLVEFVQTPQEDSPYGTRAFSEHGIIGIPAALGNALSCAMNTPLNFLPLTPEKIWRTCNQ